MKNSIEVKTDFSQTVLKALEAQEKSKRWLYYKLEMAPITLDSRLKNNDWRLEEIIKISELLGLTA